MSTGPSSRTKKSLAATECCRAKGRRARAGWLTHRLPAVHRQAKRLVFIDEASVKTDTIHLRGQSFRSERRGWVQRLETGHPDFHRRIGAHRFDRAWVHQGRDGWSGFAAYIRETLLSEFTPGTLVIPGNRLHTGMPRPRKRCAKPERGPLRSFSTPSVKTAIFPRLGNVGPISRPPDMSQVNPETLLALTRLCCANQLTNGSPLSPDGFIPRLS